MAERGRGAATEEAARRRQLRTLWSGRSRLAGWDAPEDWWTPVVDHLCAAAAAGGDLAPGCLRLGQARARAGIGVGRALSDLAAFTDALEWPEPPLALVRALAEGWADSGRSPDECQDPLTGLATAAFLRTRLGELYRGGGSVAGHRLVIVALDGATDPWRRTASLIVLGHELGRFFVHAESIALLSRVRMAVLSGPAPDFAERARHLRESICREHGAELWTVPLPNRLEEARALLGDIARPLTA
ncbi:hypothetical protein [Nocardiopsis coralliicola]